MEMATHGKKIWEKPKGAGTPTTIVLPPSPNKGYRFNVVCNAARWQGVFFELDWENSPDNWGTTGAGERVHLCQSLVPTGGGTPMVHIYAWSADKEGAPVVPNRLRVSWEKSGLVLSGEDAKDGDWNDIIIKFDPS